MGGRREYSGFAGLHALLQPAGSTGHEVSRLTLFLFLALVLATPAASRDSAHGPTLFLPGRADSAATDVPPLLIPGRPFAPDTLRKTAAQKARTFYEHGLQLERDGLPEPALASFRNAAGFDPTIPGLYQHIATIYEAFGALPEAAKAYAEEVRRHPQNRDATRSLGLTLVRLGETERGIQHLELLVRSNTRDGASWRALGYAYTHAKRWAEAEKALRTAIALPPPDAEEYRDLGVLLANRGREAEARTLYAKAARLDPHDASVFVNLGNLEMRSGNPERALVQFREAEVRDSSYAVAYRAEVGALQALGRDDDIGDTYRRWLRRAPDDEDARLEAVQYFLRKGRGDVALETGRDGVRRNLRSAFARMTLGVAEAGAGDARGALASLRWAEAAATATDQPEVTSQARALISELKAGAPDSLHSLFVADSLAIIAAAARRDSLRRLGPGVTRLTPKKSP